MFGLNDTKDNLWMGNDEGPLLYEDEEVAKVAAQIVDRSLHQVMGRTRALPYMGQAVRLRDQIPVLTDPVAALGQLEDGY